jgi:hypothetical protein
VDLRVSRKETRLQPSGAVEVLTSNVFDLYPVYSPTDPNLIMDVEMLDDDREELLDRAMFGTVKQRGADPLDIYSGVQWAEAVLGEVSIPVVQLQIQGEIQQEGPGVTVTYDTVVSPSGKQYFQYAVKLTNSA